MVILEIMALGTKGNSISGHYGESPLTVSSKQETARELSRRRTPDTLASKENDIHHSPFSFLGFLDKQVHGQVSSGQALEKR
jgi:hypothetical protein